ncbi:MAG: hypothetical protein KAT25_05440 [Sulfuriflexus sp.]|nr:hypothetical protein [Sulfuriflexus sp.]
MANMAQNEDKLVALASIAAELHSVMNVAYGVSLAAKNAKVISAQAGDKGLGFQPITDFIDEISQLAIEGVSTINENALRLSKIAVHEQRSYDAYKRFTSVIKKNEDAAYIKSLNPSMDRVETHMIKSFKEFRNSMKDLFVQLEEMDKHMLSARAIASVSRVVTSNAQEFRAKLDVVADNLDNAAVFIKDKVSDSYEHLDRVKTLTREHA